MAAAPRLALIHGDTVSGSPSLEEQAAVAAGFTVTVVPDATWATMTAADFGQYELLIVGDPTCGFTFPPGLVATAPEWGPVVLGTAGGRTQAGNRIVIGTDPVFHQTQGGSVLVTEGTDFAGKQPGRTGMYLDLTCAGSQLAQVLTLLNAISSPAASGAWTVNPGPPCGAAASLIASVPGSFPTLTSANLQGWFCSVHESFPTFKGDFAALAVATDTPTHPTCGVDKDTGLEACGEAYILVAGSGIVVISGSISLDPVDDTNPVDTDHTVTAHVSSGGAPLANQLVTFEVTGVNAGAVGTCSPGTCISDAAGNVTFTYHGTNTGDDTIKASFTDTAGSLQSATAQKHWTGGGVGAPATLDLSPATATNTVGTQHCVTATVKDAAGSPTPGITVNFSVAGPNGPLSGSAVTDANGQAQFCYTGTHAGDDTITATAVGGSNPSDTATKTWTAVAAVDHYKCYAAEQKEPRHVSGLVDLKDQFGEAQMTLGKARQICNPVSKNGEPIVQADAHFKVYDVKAIETDEDHDDLSGVTPSSTDEDEDDDGDADDLRVEVTNQFGTEILKVKKPKLLLVPASKSIIPPALGGDDPGDPPQLVDHYLCYDVDASHFELTVTLEDQFGRGEAKVRGAKLLCNPVSKDGSTVLQPDSHLVCYTIKTDKDPKRLVNMHDQFGLSVLRTGKAETLCVPSTKRILPPTPEDSHPS